MQLKRSHTFGPRPLESFPLIHVPGPSGELQATTVMITDATALRIDAVVLLLQHPIQSRQQLLVVRDEPIVGAELVPLENALDVEVILLGQTQR